jgi:hypothetical protein
MVMHNLPGRAKCLECGSENLFEIQVVAHYRGLMDNEITGSRDG